MLSPSSHHLIPTLIRLIKEHIRLIINTVFLLRFLEEILFALVLHNYLRLYMLVPLRSLGLQFRTGRRRMLQL